jgi:hypothetical protein
MAMFAQASWKKWIGFLSAVLVGVSAAGCRGRVAQVSGKVSYAGRPLPGGAILLLASNGQAHHGQIDDDGRFTLADVPAGKARVCVSSLVETPWAGGRPDAAAGRVTQPSAVSSRIPYRYADLGQSGLTVDVKNGSPIELDLQ